MYKTKKDPIYYNLSLNRGLDQGPTTASFTEINNSPILFDSGEWYLSLMRTCIPSGNIPRYIFPIETGPTQSNINLGHNVFSFRYVTGINTATNAYTFQDLPNINDYSLNVNFVSEIINPSPVGTNSDYSLPYPPSQYPLGPQPKGQQDLSGAYYYIYSIQSLVSMFNNTLATLWVTYITAWNITYPQNPLPANIAPYFNYDEATQLWSFNAEITHFIQTQGTSFTPFVAVFCDNLTLSNTQVPSRFIYETAPDANNNYIQNLLQVNYYYNNTFSYTTNGTTYTFLENTACQSSTSSLASFQKIVFEIGGDILVRHNEIDAIGTKFQSTNLISATSQKPTLAMLVDIEIDKEQWAKNSSFIQFQASSIEQVRLIGLSNRASVQNFTLNIFWIDTYGNRHPLQLTSVGNPLTLKLAFFNK